MPNLVRRAFLTARERSGQRVTLGFTGIADFRSVIGQEYIAGVTKAARDYGVNLVNFGGAIKYSLSDDIDFFRHFTKKYRYIRPNVVDGLVTWASSLGPFLDNDAIRALHERLKPLPMVDLGVPLLSGVPSVTIVVSEGIRLVMDHLKAHGYTRFGFVGCSAGSQYQERLAAWRGELARNGWDEDPDLVGILDSLEAKDIHRWVDGLCRRFSLRGRAEVDALVTVSDLAAGILVDELHRRGIRVPQDVAVTGFNNQVQSVGSVCPITTVDLGYFQRGYAAVELLIDRIAEPDRTFGSVTMGTSLVVRQSCGCFESEVSAVTQVAQFDPPSDFRPYLLRQLACELGTLPSSHRESLVEALVSDLNGGGDGLLGWLQRALAVERALAPERLGHLQNVVSVVRRTVLALGTTPDIRRMEDIFHQARVVIALSSAYYERSRRSESALFNTLARAAASFTAALTVADVLDAVRTHLSDLEIPGILLVLQEEPTPDLGGGRLELVLPPPSSLGASIPLRIHESAFVPRSFFPRDRAWVMMFQVLFVAGSYLGYALLEAGPANVALYDALRSLLSQSLLSVYSRAGRHSRARDRLMETETVARILGAAPVPGAGTQRLEARTIVDYLADRLGEMTNLVQMAQDLSLSKSYLIRRTKALTGYTVQTLHELLKMERAKILLETHPSKVSQVAAQLGYQNQSYFSAVFKRRTGVSPREWVRGRVL
jgi:DNA-binding LacI/PurR family transcriptional regulator/AraC-like DNA-binding protein